MLTDMSQPARGDGKEAMETAINTPSLRDVQPPAPKRRAGPRPWSSWTRRGAADTATTSYSAILRRDKEPMDDDMTDCSDAAPKS